MKRICITLTLWWLCALAFGQANCKLSITGTLTDKQTNENLAFANIYVVEIKSGAVTDENGSFALNNLCAGTYTLKIEHIGCHTLTKKVTLTESLRLAIQLDHSAHELSEVEVNATRNVTATGQTMSKIEGIALKQRMGENLGNALSNLSGVNVLQTGATVAKPIIHGMHSNRVLILNNGVRQEGQQWGAEHAPEIDPFMAKKITLIKGANAIKYGADAIGGVILVEPGRLPDTAGVTGEVNLAGATNGRMGSASATIEGNISELKNLKFRLQGTAKKAGNMRSPSRFLDNTGLSEKNFSVGLGFDSKKTVNEFFYSRFTTEIGIYTGAHLGNTADLIKSYAGSNTGPEGSFSYNINRPKQQIDHELLKLKSTFQLNNFNRLLVQYSRQYNNRQEYDRHRPKNDSLAALNQPEFQYHITTHLLDVEYQLHHHHHFEGSMGVQGMLQANTYNGRYFIPNFKNRGIGLYWTERYHTGNWQFEAGLRADYRHLQIFKLENQQLISPSYNYRNPSASAGINYQAKEWLTLSVFSGTAWRPPAANELFSNGLHHGSATIEIGNRNLKPESSWNNSFSLSVNREKLKAELSYYHNTLTNFINLVPSGQNSLTIRGAFPSYVYTQQNAIFQGVDAQVEYNVNDQLKIKTQYNRVRARERKTGNYLALIPPDNIKGGAEYRFALPRAGSYLSINLQLNYVCRQTRYPQQQLISLENGTLTTVSDFAPPPADYLLVEPMLTLEYPVSGHQLLVSVGATNLLNKSYRNYLNRFRYFTDEAGSSFQIRVSMPFSVINYN